MSATIGLGTFPTELHDFFSSNGIGLETSQINEILKHAPKRHPEHLLSETDRAWVRMRALHNLLSPTSTYAEFIAAQPEDERLSEGSYDSLKKQMQEKLADPIALTAEFAMILMDSVKGVEHVAKGDDLPKDTVQFFFATGQDPIKYYPELELSDDVAERIKAYTAVPVHFRHFFFGEGPASSVMKKLLAAAASFTTAELKLAINGLDAFWRNNMLGFRKPIDSTMGATWRDNEHKAHQALVEMLNEFAESKDPEQLIDAGNLFYAEQATIAGTDLSSVPETAKGYLARTLAMIEALPNFKGPLSPELEPLLMATATNETQLFANESFSGVSHLPVIGKKLKEIAGEDLNVALKAYFNLCNQIFIWAKEAKPSDVPLYNLANSQNELLSAYIKFAQADTEAPEPLFEITKGRFASLMLTNKEAIIEASLKLEGGTARTASPTGSMPVAGAPAGPSSGGAAGAALEDP